MDTPDITTGLAKHSDHSGTPEHYLVVKEQYNPDTDALLCALSRASAVCKMLSLNFDDDNDTLNTTILANACWALNGLIDQAIIITEGKAA